ncbi:Fructose-bisphosphate aldolase, partial [Trametes pubescens]
NGWDVDLLQTAIDTCTGANGNVMDCPALAAVFDQDAADACVLETSIVDENIGLSAPIAALPGCNQIGNSGTSVCTNLVTPQLVPAQEPLLSGWPSLGCIAEGTSGRALPALTIKDPAMTKAIDECYCDNSVKNGASMSFLTWSECNNHCVGNTNEICGGAAKLSLLSTGVAGASSPSSPSSLPPYLFRGARCPPATESIPMGWTSAGCVSDSGARGLTGYSFVSDSRSLTTCVSTCASKGFSMAGVEYGRECYCGNSLQNGNGNALAASSLMGDLYSDMPTLVDPGRRFDGFYGPAPPPLPMGVGIPNPYFPYEQQRGPPPICGPSYVALPFPLPPVLIPSSQNVTSSSVANSVLEAARDIKSPIIIQVSQGGSAFFAGNGLANDKQQASITGAVAAVHHVRAVAKAYGVPVVLHSDHCAKKLLPWFDGMLAADGAARHGNSIDAGISDRLQQFLEQVSPVSGHTDLSVADGLVFMQVLLQYWR